MARLLIVLLCAPTVLFPPRVFRLKVPFKTFKRRLTAACGRFWTQAECYERPKYRLEKIKMTKEWMAIL